MNDKELLMMAANAIGLNVKACSVDCDDNFNGLIVGPKFKKDKKLWSPLLDDGDALRLAVKLDMTVNIQGKWVMVDCGDITKRDYDDNDTLLATRRAIVRAAAEIGGKL